MSDLPIHALPETTKKNLSNIPKATERTRASAYFSEHSLQDASSRLVYNLN